MTDAVYDLLSNDFESPVDETAKPSRKELDYISQLANVPLAKLSTEEPKQLSHLENSNVLALQALSSRSHRSVITASNSLSSLEEHLPTLQNAAQGLRDAVPLLDGKILEFAERYSKSNTENAVLDRRKRATLVSQNVDRLTDILELPALLSSAINASASSAGAAGGVNYSQALDLSAHIKRLEISHPNSALIKSILAEAETAMREMTSNLVLSLRAQNIRLAAAIRTIGWLRRVAPEMGTGLPQTVKLSGGHASHNTSEGSFGYLFLICRLYNLLNMLEALTPLRDLADQETQQRFQKEREAAQRSVSDQLSPRKTPLHSPHPLYTGQQTERYLKRYIEIFREQSFATVSMFKNIFPASEDAVAGSTPFLAVPSPLLTFPAHLVSLLFETLKAYVRNLTDQSARDAIFMQVLYAAGSLGRLGADFGLIIADLCDEEAEDEDQGQPRAEKEGDSDAHGEATSSLKEKVVPEWMRVLKKHRLQSSKLEALSAAPPLHSPPIQAGNTDLPLRNT